MDESEFWRTNRPLLFLAIKGLWAPGWTIDDLINEARYGLWQARETWNPDKSSWYSYALLVARRRVLDFVAHSNRQKNRMLHGYSDLESSGCYKIPEECFELDETKEAVKDLLQQVELTKIEQSVIELWLLDYRYKEIAEHLGVTYKMVDNAYQRVLKKLRKSNSDTRDFSFLP